MTFKRTLHGVSGAFICGYLWLVCQYFVALLTRQGAPGDASMQLAGGLFIVTLYSLFFALGYTPLWIGLGIAAAWRVPKLAERDSWLRAYLEGAALGAVFQLVFAGVIAGASYGRGEYRNFGDIIGRFAENIFTPAAPLALIIFAVWINSWRHRAALLAKSDVTL